MAFEFDEDGDLEAAAEAIPHQACHLCGRVIEDRARGVDACTIIPHPGATRVFHSGRRQWGKITSPYVDGHTRQSVLTEGGTIGEWYSRFCWSEAEVEALTIEGLDVGPDQGY